MPSVVMPVPQEVCIMLKQHIGSTCKPLVKVGDKVKVGQVIGESDEWCSAKIHSSVSGEVIGVADVMKPNGVRVPCINIKTDGLQEKVECTVPQINSHAEFVEAVHNAGIVGLGGAGFPTHIKLNPENLDQVHTLIINGAECEPYITSDNRTMVEQQQEILTGTQAILKWLDLKQAIIAIEVNKPNAIAEMKRLNQADSRITVAELPTPYPQGAEKVTIYNVMNGLVVPKGKLPADVGIIVSNVTTVAEIGRYLQDGMPLTTKRVTVDGSGIKKPQNVIAPIGTIAKDMIEFCGGTTDDLGKLIMGGPMMGMAMEDDSFPLIKNNNALVALNRKESISFAETPCINCGACVRGCPMRLMPNMMKQAQEAGRVDLLKKYKANLCIECGVCSYVCPARQELVQSHIRSKELIRNESK